MELLFGYSMASNILYSPYYEVYIVFQVFVYTTHLPLLSFDKILRFEDTRLSTTFGIALQ